VIYVCGNVSDSAQLLKNADVFVGVSRAALEAMSCGIPVVLAGDEGFLGVLGEGNIEHAESTNFCCRGCSAVEDNELFSALIKILDTPKATRKSIGAWLREYVVKTHSVAIMAEQTERFYSGFLTCFGRENDGVLLCGYYGFGNMGDDLLLNGAIKYARKKYGNIALCALTKNGKKDSDRFGVKCVFRSNIFAVAKEIKRAKYVVFGGGTLLQNSTSLRSLLYYLFILKYAQKKKKPTELWGNGIGNIKGWLWRKKTAEILCECHFVGLRDKASLLEAVQLLGEFSGAVPLLSLESDISHLADVSGGNIEKHVLKLFGGHCRFALIAPRGVEKKGQTESLVAWCEHLHASGIGLVVAPMYPAQDLDICKWLARRFSGKLVYPSTLAELCALAKRAELVCSMRYHGLVLAANAGTPFIGFGAEEKIKSFCAENGGVYFSDIDK
jgi:polysaccharide pyruvyl transferase CsaB